MARANSGLDGLRSKRERGLWSDRAIARLVVCALIAGGLPILSATPAAAATSGLIVHQWNANTETGRVTYSVELTASGLDATGGPCSGTACYYKLEGFYRNGTTDVQKASMAQGSASGSSGLSKIFSGTNEQLPELTDLKATIWPYNGAGRETLTSWVHVSDPYPTGSVALTINNWDRNVETGKISYNVDLTTRGAGQVGGPCDGNQCFWKLEGFYKSGTTEVQKSSIASGSYYDSPWSFTKNFTAANASMPELTDLKATVWPYNGAGRETYTAWAHVSDPYPDGGVVLDIKSWDRNSNTGLTSYNVDLIAKGAGQIGGPCDGTQCFWKLEGFYKDGSTESQIASMGSGSYYDSPWSFTKNFTATNTTMDELTDLKATVWPYNGSGRETYTTWAHVSDPYPSGAVDLTVNSWTSNVETGKTSYDLKMSARGLAQRGGPCYGTMCLWKLEGYYRNGTTEVLRSSMAAGSYNTNPWTFTKTFTATNETMPELTDLKATVYPYNGAGRETYTSGWVHVSDAYPDGSISFSVSNWQHSNGLTDYVLNMNVAGAAQEGGPCYQDTCTWELEGDYYNSSGQLVTETVASGGLASGTWASHWQITMPSAALPSITNLRAVLRADDQVREVYTYERFVGDHTVADEDMIPYEAALAAALTSNPVAFCDVLGIGGGKSLNGNTAPDVWEACVAAVQTHGPNIAKVLAAIAAAAGGAIGLRQLLEEHVKEDDIPSVDEEARPSPAPTPLLPPDWEDEGCAFEIIYTQNSEAHLVTHGHLYAFRHMKPGQSWFFEWVSTRWLAEFYGPLEIPAPDPNNPINCRRDVTYSETTDIGVDRETGRTGRFRLITRKATGEVVTMFPIPRN